MQRNALQDLDAIDAVMTEFPESAFGELTIVTSTHGRISHALSKRQSNMHRADSLGTALESLESRMVPSAVVADTQMHTETYTDHQMLSFAGLPNGTYPKGQWHVFSLQDGTKIKTFNDEADVIVDNGTIRTQKSNGDSSWIWVGFEDGAARTVSALDMRYDPNSGGSAQPKITFGSNDDDQQKLPLTGSGLFPVNQLFTRAVIETFEHRGTAIAGIELAVVKTREVASVSPVVTTTIATSIPQTVPKTQTETYTEHQFVSFSNIPDGTYSKGIFHTVNLTPEVKIRLYSDDNFTVSGGVITPNIGSGNDWIHLSLADGQTPLLISSVRVRYSPSGGIAQGTLSVLSEDDTNRVIGISEQGDIPVQGPIKRILMALERHDGALLGVTMDSIKTREVAVVSQSSAATISTVSAETLTTIAQAIPLAPETDPHAPFLRAVSVQGSNITLAVSSPMVGGNTVMFAGLHDDGLFTNAIIDGTTDGSVTPVSLGMNAANPTGDYSIVLIGGPDRKTLSSIRVHWDYDAKKLSLCNGTTLWECQEAQGKAINEQMQEVLALANNPTTGSGVLAAMQQESLIDGLKSLPSPMCGMAPDFETSFWNAHPEWKDDAMHEMAMRQFNTQTSQYSVTQIFNSIVTQRNDTMSILRDAYSRFHSMLGDLLQQGITVLSEVRGGGNEPDIRRNFAILVDQYATSLPMYQLSSIGIRIADANTLLEAVKSVWTVKCEEMIELKAGETKIAAQQRYREQLVANGFVQAADGTMVAATDPRATTGLIYHTDSQGRLTILPQEQGQNFSTQTPTTLVADIFNTQTQLSKEHLYLSLGTGKELTDPLQLTVQPKKSSVIEFHIDEEKMVSFGTPGIFGRNLTLRISGTGLGDTTYASEKAGITGESISLRLPKGDYSLVIQDNTDYSDLVHAPLADESFPVMVETNIKPYHSAKIEGLISIEGNEKVMPVGMSVAAFDTKGNRVDLDPITKQPLTLDPSKPVWIVIHGMDSSENDSTINELAKALYGYAATSDIQVATIDWKDAAQDGTLLTQDAPWTPAVGQWVARRLIGAGFDPSKINFAGWSHGSYAAFEAAREVERMTGSQINTLVALDAARNYPIISGYDQMPINFAAVSRNSLAFDSSIIAGDNALSSTADVSLEVRSSSINPLVRHRLAVTAFTEILNHERQSSSNFSSYLSLQKMMGSAQDNAKQYSPNAYDGCFEGVIDVGIVEVPKDDGTYYQAIPTMMTLKKPDTALEEKVYF